jgi:phosphoribosyl-ATP pyrophosphohydrolase/phosphoribosyl-AMP cyclohydrolase
MKVNFDAQTGLVPVIIQEAKTLQVRMLGYMNKEAFEKTNKEGKVCFFSRSKQRLWTKGEESGNFLWVKKIMNDCDSDSLLILVDAEGPTCHKGTDSCWGIENQTPLNAGFTRVLEDRISQRWKSGEEGSYIQHLKSKGLNKIAQKVGEEATEVIIEAIDKNDQLFLEESADLLFHYLVLLRARDKSLNDVLKILKDRYEK